MGKIKRFNENKSKYTDDDRDYTEDIKPITIDAIKGKIREGLRSWGKNDDQTYDKDIHVLAKRIMASLNEEILYRVELESESIATDKFK